MVLQFQRIICNREIWCSSLREAVFHMLVSMPEMVRLSMHQVREREFAILRYRRFAVIQHMLGQEEFTKGLLPLVQIVQWILMKTCKLMQRATVLWLSVYLFNIELQTKLTAQRTCVRIRAG